MKTIKFYVQDIFNYCLFVKKIQFYKKHYYFIFVNNCVEGISHIENSCRTVTNCPIIDSIESELRVTSESRLFLISKFKDKHIKMPNDHCILMSFLFR